MIQITQTISPGSYFKLSNGQIIKNLKELPDAIQRVDENVFRSHVNENKNDFAAWIYNVYRLSDLSAKLGPVKSKDETVRIIKAYLHQQLSAKPIVTKQPIHTIQKPKPIIPTAKPVQTIPKKPLVYPWKSNESVSIDQKPKVQTQIKQPPKLPEVKKPVIPTTNQPTKMTFKRPQAIQTVSNAEAYFQKNPMLMSQAIAAKKRALILEPIESVIYRGDETPERLVEMFNDTYGEAYERLTFLRKKGFDTSLAEIMLFRIPTRIKVYGASKQNKDSIAVKRYLNEIIEELNNMKA